MMTGDGLSDLADSLTTLGARHVAYGVLPVHYQVLETALLRTLREIVPDELWSETARKGWAAVFKFIGQAMQAGAGSQVEISKGTRKSLEAIEASPSDVLRMKINSSPSSPEPLLMPSWPVDKKSTDTTTSSVSRFAIVDPVAPKLPQRKGDDTKSVSSSSDSPPMLPRRQPELARACCSNPPTLPKRSMDENKASCKAIHDDSTACTVSETTEAADHEHQVSVVRAR